MAAEAVACRWQSGRETMSGWYKPVGAPLGADRSSGQGYPKEEVPPRGKSALVGCGWGYGSHCLCGSKFLIRANEAQSLSAATILPGATAYFRVLLG